MTVPAYIGNASAALPTGWAVGDLFVMSVESAAQVVTTPAGWTAVANSPQTTGSSGGTASTALYMFWRIAESGDTVPTVSGPADHTYKRFECFRGVDQTTPILTTSGSVLASAGLTGTATGVTTTVADCLVHLVGTFAPDRPSGDATCTIANATLTSLTSQFTGNSNSGNGGGLSTATGAKTTAGTTGSSTFTWNESTVQAMMVLAIQPPAAVTEQYAISSGNYSNDAIWSTGAKPTTGTVYSNGYNVTVDVDSSATVVTNVAGTVAVAGGSFILSNGVTLTANVYAGPSVCVTSGTVSAAIIGDSYGGSSANAYGVSKTTAGTLTLTGSVYAGSAAAAHGAYLSGAGTIAISENAYGSDSNTSAYGVRNNSSGTITIGGSAHAGTQSAAVANISSGTVTVAGYSYASAGYSGVINAGSSTNVTIGMNAIGGTSSTAYGALNSGTGTVTVAGAAVSADSPGLGAGLANTGAGYATVGTVQTGTSGVSPCVGHVHVADLSAFTALVRSASSSVTLSAEVGLPSPFEPSPVFGGA